MIWETLADLMSKNSRTDYTFIGWFAYKQSREVGCVHTS
jgi:hypothetical protein